MAGEALTNAFVLSTATVMIGTQADVFDLTPADNSIGLVKNFTVTAEPSYNDLTQGVKNNIVYSVLTDNPVRASMEVYEFTSKNMSYGLGLDGAGLTAQNTLLLNATASAAATTCDAESATDVSGDYATGDWISIQSVANPDLTHLAVLSGVPTYVSTTLTFNFTAWAIGANTNFIVGDKVSKVERVNVGSKLEQPFLGAKVVGILPEANKPITLIIPKLRITRGFSLAFTSDNYGNLPFEFTPFELVAADPFYTEFLNLGVMGVFSGN